MAENDSASLKVLFDIADGVGRLTLNRPDAANALDLELAQQLRDAVERAADPAVRCVLVAGSGKRFCGGGDLAAMDAATDSEAYVRELAGTVDEALCRLAELPIPVVAVVHGSVAGAGLAIMLTADLIVAEASTKLLMAYSNAALTPDCGVSWMLPRSVGTHRALEFALTGRVLSAQEARDWGMVTEVVDDGTGADRALGLATSMAAGPYEALGQTRRLIRESWTTDRRSSGADEAATIARSVTTPAAQQRIASFLKR